MIAKKCVSFYYMRVHIPKVKAINIKFAQSAVSKPTSCGLSRLTNSLRTQHLLESATVFIKIISVSEIISSAAISGRDMY